MSDRHHVYPVADLIEHEMTEDCVCGPEIQPVKRDDGSIGWLVVHASLDGREHIEERPHRHRAAPPTPLDG